MRSGDIPLTLQAILSEVCWSSLKFLDIGACFELKKQILSVFLEECNLGKLEIRNL